MHWTLSDENEIHLDAISQFFFNNYLTFHKQFQSLSTGESSLGSKNLVRKRSISSSAGETASVCAVTPTVVSLPETIADLRPRDESVNHEEIKGNLKSSNEIKSDLDCEARQQKKLNAALNAADDLVRLWDAIFEFVYDDDDEKRKQSEKRENIKSGSKEKQLSNSPSGKHGCAEIVGRDSTEVDAKNAETAGSSGTQVGTQVDGKKGHRLREKHQQSESVVVERKHIVLQKRRSSCGNIGTLRPSSSSTNLRVPYHGTGTRTMSPIVKTDTRTITDDKSKACHQAQVIDSSKRRHSLSDASVIDRPHSHQQDRDIQHTGRPKSGSQSEKLGPQSEPLHRPYSWTLPSETAPFGVSIRLANRDIRMERAFMATSLPEWVRENLNGILQLGTVAGVKERTASSGTKPRSASGGTGRNSDGQTTSNPGRTSNPTQYILSKYACSPKLTFLPPNTLESGTVSACDLLSNTDPLTRTINPVNLKPPHPDVCPPTPSVNKTSAKTPTGNGKTGTANNSNRPLSSDPVLQLKEALAKLECARDSLADVANFYRARITAIQNRKEILARMDRMIVPI